ncbi:phosphoglycerate kinase [Candidatus Uhrbacteria bacterium RIFCSPHIGHO2_02_FULL_60_44]|nr:MAG: phosphoglycerate kinase [Candidatus Uhrbacteria bacterium RIFCSPHIGHO2_02_FULL_60_44]
MKLRPLPPGKDLGCLRIYVRVDWNIPHSGEMGEEESLKITRSYPLLFNLRKRGAIVFVLTHLGRPKGRDKTYSTKPLATLVKVHSGLPITFMDVDLASDAGRKKFARDVDVYTPGDVVLLENVRFQAGEETNDPKLVAAYAKHADAFVNDAFASCHRAHASVTGLAKALPSFAGPALLQEVSKVGKLLERPKRPYLAFIGGSKLTTKLPVIQSLLKTADRVYVGGAMAHAFFTAKRMPIGASYIEKEGVSDAKKIMGHPKLVLPGDVCVAKKLAPGARPRCVALSAVKKQDVIGDIGTETMRAWASDIRTAKTIVWNGPVGVTELPAFSHGSLVLGRAIAARSRGKTYGVVGGGDTLPVVARTGMSEYFDFISTGGGAMLEFIATRGKLPGLSVLSGTQKKGIPAVVHSKKEHGSACGPTSRKKC